ncbi:MAG: TIGR02678 family protein [Deltaproteobacteria bacterium]|nr:TIGR02678 family protein [Deltaproteobacteria bacterium]
MSRLSSVMEAERAGERSRALKHLLAHPLTLSANSPEAFAAIARHREYLTAWFADHPGWKLSVDVPGGFARLHKVPFGTSATRAAQPSGRSEFDRRRYTLFCLALAAFNEIGAQTTLMTLAQRVEELSIEEEGAIEPFETTSGHERRAFVDALRLLMELGVLRVREGDTDRYALSRETDALFDVNDRVLAHLLSSPIPPAFASGPQELLDEVFPDTEEGQRQRHRMTVFRRLLDDPVLYFEDLEADAVDWLDHARGWLYRVLEHDAGFTVEKRAEGLCALDPSSITSDTSFPDGGSTAKHAALLLAEQWVRLNKEGIVRIRRADVVELIRRLQRDFGERCGWSKQYPPDDDGCGRLADEALRLLEAFDLASESGDGWRARPAIARFRPGAPTRKAP